ncbi:MAG: hypothetical protein ACYSR5_11165, partial [Planctomycetota bacterium]
FEPKPPYEPIAAETLQTLTELSQQPDQLENPLALAEVLFLSGHLKEAATFYQLALNQISPEQPDQTQNRPWILFQIANCLRNSDPTAAMKTCRRKSSGQNNRLVHKRKTHDVNSRIPTPKPTTNGVRSK